MELTVLGRPLVSRSGRRLDASTLIEPPSSPLLVFGLLPSSQLRPFTKCRASIHSLTAWTVPSLPRGLRGLGEPTLLWCRNESSLDFSSHQTTTDTSLMAFTFPPQAFSSTKAAPATFLTPESHNLPSNPSERAHFLSSFPSRLSLRLSGL